MLFSLKFQLNLLIDIQNKNVNNRQIFVYVLIIECVFVILISFLSSFYLGLVILVL